MRPTIAELEAALEDGAEIEIRPDGTVKRKRRKRRSLKPLTVGQSLGSNY